jgi:hypothetical protein
MGNLTSSDRINEIIADPLAAEGLRAGIATQRIRAVARGEPTYKIGLDPNGNPNTQTLQTLKIGLDSLLESRAAQNPKTGGLSQYGQAVNEYRAALVKEMGLVNPTYARANEIYGGPMQVRDAIAAGRQMPLRGRYQDTPQEYWRDLESRSKVSVSEMWTVSARC